MSSAPSNEPSHQPVLQTTIAQFVDVDGEPLLGVRVVEPPPDTRQALRGNLYAVVEVSDPGPAGEQLSERILSLIQRTYYTAKGSQSQVLIEAMRQARQKVHELNAQQPDNPMRVGIICAALLGVRLMILHNGPALALITSGEKVERYPSDLINLSVDEMPDRPANWEIYRQELLHGGAFFVGGGRWLDAVPVKLLAGTVAHLTSQNCALAAEGLLAESRLRDLPGLLVVAEPTAGRKEAPTLPDEEGQSTRTTATPQSSPSRNRRRPFSAGLPTAVNAPPPVRDVPTVPEDDPHPAPPNRMQAPPTAPATTQPTGLPGTGADDWEAPQGMVQPEHDDGDPTHLEDPEDWEISHLDETADQDAAHRGGATAALAGGLERARDLVAGVLPDLRPRQDDPAAAPVVDDDSPRRQAVAAAAPVAATARDGAYRDVDVEPFTPPPPATGSRARLFVLVAVLILALVPVVVAAMSWRDGVRNREEAQSLVELAQARYRSALDALEAGDQATARAMLSEADEHLTAATGIIGATSEITTLSADVQRELQDVLQIRYLYELVEPLARFPQDALPSRVLVADENIFVLDTGRQAILRYEFDNSRRFVSDPQGEVVLRAGDTIDGATVGRLVDFAWQPIIPGYEDKANLLILDRNNQIFRYNQRVEGVQRVDLGVSDALQIPNQIEVYLGRTYVTDEGADQIFRYEPGGFAQTPANWFAEQTRADLSGLTSMGIDGDIWLMFDNGAVVRYNRGEQLPFSLDSGGVGLASEPVDMAVGGQDGPSLYIADAAQERILVFDKSGAYQFQLMAPEGNLLRGLRGLFVDEVDGQIFILTETSLYQHAIPN